MDTMAHLRGAHVIPLLSLATALAAEPADPCALEPKTIPDFTLFDMNLNSPTYLSKITPATYTGSVLVMYWAQAT